MPHSAEIAAIILAAGKGARFGSDPNAPKILAPLAGKPLIRHVAEAARASLAQPLIVVLGPASEKAQSALAGLDANCLVNNDPEAGLSRSLALGLSAVPERCAGAIILLADMPRIRADIIDRLVAAFRDAKESPRAVIPVRAGRHGNPVLLGRAIFPAVMQLTGDRGARALLRGETRGIIECPINDVAIEIDVDTKESLAELARQMLGV
ncbi:MAG: NTP transferase domain-containing protein [Methylovirgula sp.]